MIVLVVSMCEMTGCRPDSPHDVLRFAFRHHGGNLNLLKSHASKSVRGKSRSTPSVMSLLEDELG
jgi:hypothetical protein